MLLTQVVHESITTTDTTTTTNTGTPVTTHPTPDQYNYQTGTAQTNFTTVTTTGTTTTTVTVKTETNTYQSYQQNWTASAVAGGSAVTGTQLTYMPPQDVVIQITQDANVSYTSIIVGVPVIAGYGTGPTRLLVERPVYSGATLVGCTPVYDQETFGNHFWSVTPPHSDAFIPRVRVWKGGVPLIDSAATGQWSYDYQYDYWMQSTWNGSTRSGIAVSGNLSGVTSAAVSSATVRPHR